MTIYMGLFVLNFPIKKTCFFTSVSNGPLWNHWILVQLWIDIKTKFDFKIMLPSIYHLYHFMAQHHPLFTTTLEFQIWCICSTFFYPWNTLKCIRSKNFSYVNEMILLYGTIDNKVIPPYMYVEYICKY